MLKGQCWLRLGEGLRVCLQSLKVCLNMPQGMATNGNNGKGLQSWGSLSNCEQHQLAQGSKEALDMCPVQGVEPLTMWAKMSFMLSTMSPGSVGVPTMLCVLPEPVAP